ncbi:hypothetical protein BO83DRAFT_418854 [Aspergillus eucalypticola CBS 122712]|uniref:Uncharacterized protein n=1 Tax=Aspergillus eucalypticola (strain CBS 122712 / IBT 29274) TaxID=1448314 RepID=A0A317V7W5_ASPEC|nr:uncharacterized protein BO83DRAFT_418854 [Aspergillus eucalypticola CBS 122712]PWY68210.1 hypothetical protein BO83DRAFT_418854 [Aspergillus eucalypticola CBS 122712]
MGDRGPGDIAIEQPPGTSSPTETSPSSPKPPKLNKRRKSKKLSSPPLEKVDSPKEDQQGPGESSPTDPTAAPADQGGDQSNSQEQPQDTGSKMTDVGGDVGNLTKGVGDKAGGVKDTVKEITTGGMNMNIDDPDLQWETPEKSGSLQIRVRLNLRAKVQLNLDARVKGEVVIGLL